MKVASDCTSATFSNVRGSFSTSRYRFKHSGNRSFQLSEAIKCAQPWTPSSSLAQPFILCRGRRRTSRFLRSPPARQKCLPRARSAATALLRSWRSVGVPEKRLCGPPSSRGRGASRFGSRRLSPISGNPSADGSFQNVPEVAFWSSATDIMRRR